MKTHRHLWQRVVSPENLMAAAADAMRGKRGRGSAARFFSRWETEVWRLHEELVCGEYRPGAYTYFKIHEPKERMVAAAPFRDRVVHHALVRVLQPISSRASSRTALPAGRARAPMRACGGQRNSPAVSPVP